MHARRSDAMGLMDAPRGMRLHIGIFGRRNVGKSSLLNAITRQDVSIVCEFAGTTTDPVEKPMELLPLGPVLFIDTAGIDDVGALGELRAKRTMQVFDRTDLGVLVTEAGAWGEFEDGILDEFQQRETPVVVVFNKIDLHERPAPGRAPRRSSSSRRSSTAAHERRGVLDFRQALLDAAPPDFIDNPTILGDLVEPGELAVLVVPIDKEAPRGRLILPQVQAIRDLLDSRRHGDGGQGARAARRARAAQDAAQARRHRLAGLPQGRRRHAARRPDDLVLDPLRALQGRPRRARSRGTLAIERLRSGATILIAEACSHHPIGEDIGRVKIPRWLTQYVGGKLDVHHVQGHDFPDDLTGWDLVIHCGACTFNRRAMLARILRAREAGVPLTNYGLVIAYSLGIFERALQPFPGGARRLPPGAEGAGGARARGGGRGGRAGHGRAARRRRRRRAVLSRRSGTRTSRASHGRAA